MALAILTRERPDMSIKNLAALALTASVAACGSSGDTAALLIESSEACSTVCAEHPHIESIAYEAGGGSPLLFSGRIASRCACTGAGR